MQIFRELVATTEYTAVALGYFDGVHIGHKEVISSAVKCKEEGLTPAVFTFSSTPKGFAQLSDFQEKCKRFEDLGVEILYVIDFDLIKSKTPQEFVSGIVKQVFNAKKVFCGFNYHFGKDGAGNTETLIKLCEEQNIETTVVEPVLVGDTVVSSSEIRSLLTKGNVKRAYELLGYHFGITSVAIKGNRIGTKMGTPTINLCPSADFVVPKKGVYASLITIDGKCYGGVTNIGIKPTVGSNHVLWESWIPNHTFEDLYGKTIDVRLKDFIREEVKFNSIDELKSQIKKDGELSLSLLS